MPEERKKEQIFHHTPAKSFAIYERLYPALKDAMHVLADHQSPPQDHARVPGR
ncbi:MAG: hypothetical protein LBR29_04715 [Methylobacteriaceae bacterium]|nr:hypothetical protein [Methylobacteriaceae bacterium]